MTSAEQSLWAEVLTLAITEAVHGIRGLKPNRNAKIEAIEEARTYIVTPNRDFDLVCTNAGMDPDAVRDHVIPKIEAAPTPAEIVDGKRTSTAKYRTTLTHAGITKTTKEWADHTGIPRNIITGRLHMGWPVERTLTTPHTPRTLKRAA